MATKFLCVPCKEELIKAGKTVTAMGGKSQKITCSNCGKRRFGLMYEVKLGDTDTRRKRDGN